MIFSCTFGTFDEDFTYPKFPILKKAGDVTEGCTAFLRSIPICQNQDQREIRQHPNMITSYIDASQVYGSYQGLLDRLRGENGKYLVCDHNVDITEISAIRCIVICATAADCKYSGPQMRQQLLDFLRITRNHSVKNVRIRSYSGPHFPAFEMNRERYKVYGVSLRVQSECGKMWTRITPNKDTFRAVNILSTDVKQVISTDGRKSKG